MMLALSRQQRRAFERNVAENEPTIKADARFFDRFPHREYRIRRMSRPEVAQLEAARGEPLPPMRAGAARFTLVKQLAPGVRLRIFVPGPGDEDGSDVSDALGASLWSRYAEQHPAMADREAALRKALVEAGRPPRDGVTP